MMLRGREEKQVTGFDVSLRRMDTDLPAQLAQWQSSYLSVVNELAKERLANVHSRPSFSLKHGIKARPGEDLF
ncbi:hypothetical protein GCM10025779_17080 [Arthrobacter cryoconiti]